MPLKVQVEQVFHSLREDVPAESDALNSGKHSQNKLTVPQNPNLLLSERSKLYEEIVSTEDKIIQEIQSRGPFKARPLNRKLFEQPRDSTAEKRSVCRQESTKFREFHLSMSKQSSDPAVTTANP